MTVDEINAFAADMQAALDRGDIGAALAVAEKFASAGVGIDIGPIHPLTPDEIEVEYTRVKSLLLNARARAISDRGHAVADVRAFEIKLSNLARQRKISAMMRAVATKCDEIAAKSRGDWCKAFHHRAQALVWRLRAFSYRLRGR